MTAEFVAIVELVELAEKVIPTPVIDFVLSGAGSEETYRRNRRAIEGPACALGVGGADGIAQLLQIVQVELRIALALAGRTDLRHLGAGLLHSIDY